MEYDQRIGTWTIENPKNNTVFKITYEYDVEKSRTEPVKRANNSTTNTNPTDRTNTRTSSSSISFTGLYRAETLGENTWAYLRFFPDGTVVSSTTSDQPHQVIKWLNQSFEYSHGTYEVNGNTIHCEITVPNGIIRYNGTINSKQSMKLNISSFNGNKSVRNYQLIYP